MLSYQHAYHAGNAADLHKHALLASALDYLTRKAKPLSYLETHAGRGLYRLDAPEALKTGEAQAGILRADAQGWLPANHPLLRTVRAVRTRHGAASYPGSPLIAGQFLRPGDTAHLAELHPAEHAALAEVAGFATLHARDGFDMAQAVCPPTPRRGLLLIDPSYEVKTDYTAIPRQIGLLARKWNVGVIALWYPLLADGRHAPMLAALAQAFPDALRSEVGFAPARPGHAMIGSGLWVLNAPFGLADEAARLEQMFRRHG
ncbi:23S rRNA (adenine(2030)-N(6))-methyltransferase RlmJ [Paracoccus spongiarum]|uniref:Ribosomal RNA large subunit methyltransferase J n=1 Tax=Paracoccus spongiarum TaxID=3064387 RepID=A0ABT9JCV6_9RHOB|nr:23S rRNA (adenine(2030)-N(6))-methyltransferase RlmJ [Paracoccus sp. 2205BS29-5]MDP5307663.1 23S rRNA (adenine(2030)-N(6))-methyltransferase RlmJ [Paracoccus sp. 2205BS29-5]